MRTLIVGASGHLGGEVARLASAAGAEVVGTSTTGASGWSKVDITDRAAVLALVSRVRPALVVNAAYRADSWAICADGAAHVALAAAAAGARLVHVSSDALHGGRAEPYEDDAVPTPIYPYGAAKAAAETAVAAIDPAAVLVRTSLIVGDERSKQVQLALDLATGRARGALFTDEVRCPIDATDLAAAILELAATDYAGLINVAGPQVVTRAELGRLVAARYGLDPATVPVCTVAESGLGARPAGGDPRRARPPGGGPARPGPGDRAGVHGRRERPGRPPRRDPAGQHPRHRPAQDPTARRRRGAERLIRLRVAAADRLRSQDGEPARDGGEAGNASHELRTPLTAQRALLQVALADPGISAAHLRAVCQDVLDLGAAQERLAGALLTLATGEQGVEHREPFDLARVAGAVVAGRAEEALRRAVDVRVDLGAAPATVDGRAVLTVRNTGAVVPPAELDRLFQPFQRLGAQRLGHTGGHGLGLAIVRAIAAAHGATLTPGGAARGAAWTSRCASADPL